MRPYHSAKDIFALVLYKSSYYMLGASREFNLTLAVMKKHDRNSRPTHEYDVLLSLLIISNSHARANKHENASEFTRSCRGNRASGPKQEDHVLFSVQHISVRGLTTHHGNTRIDKALSPSPTKRWDLSAPVSPGNVYPKEQIFHCEPENESGGMIFVILSHRVRYSASKMQA